jgi:hypothetical protein
LRAAATPNSHKEAPLQILETSKSATSPPPHTTGSPATTASSIIRCCIYFFPHFRSVGPCFRTKISVGPSDTPVAFACYRACFVGTLRGFCVRFAPHHLHNALSRFFCVFVTSTISDTHICLCAAPFVFSNVRSQTPHHCRYPQRNYFVRFVATTTDDPVYRLFYNFVCFPIGGLCSTVRAWPLNCLYRLAPRFIYACTWASLIGRPLLKYNTLPL